AEAPLPQAPREQQHALAAAAIFPREEAPAEGRFHAEQRKEVGRDVRRLDPLGLAATGERQRAPGPHADLPEALALLLPGVEVEARDVDAVHVALRVRGVDGDQLLGAREG